MEAASSLGGAWGIAFALIGAAQLAWREADYSRARELAIRSLQLRHALRDLRGIVNCLAVLARIAALGGEPAAAAQLIGGWEALRDSIGLSPSSPGLATAGSKPTQMEHARAVASVRASLGDGRFEALRAQGRAMSMDAAVAFATAEAAVVSKVAPLPDRHPLTVREWEVARLIAQGMSNRAIAEQLVVTEATVAKHVENILGRLAFANRTQIASWVVARLARTESAVLRRSAAQSRVATHVQFASLRVAAVSPLASVGAFPFSWST